ncbi:MAG TPA: peptidase C39 family protein [Candidatus Binatia bacterium]|nr:peptidase C39 family protein [Candidatus Binatia bacterium]
MKLDVPFYQQTTNLNCGPTALKMALEFLGKTFEIEHISASCGIKEGKGVSSVRLALGAAKLGFRATFLSKTLFFDPSHQQLAFYQNYSDMDVQESKRLVEEAKSAGARLEERTISLTELLTHVTPTSIPVVLLDWNKVTNTPKGYLGHFVPVVGYDDEFVLVHNQGFTNPTSFLRIPRAVFDDARKAQGTDEDVLIVSR